MDCQQAQVLLAPYVLGDSTLTALEREELEAHFAGCQACAAECRRTERVVAGIRGLPEGMLEQAFAGAPTLEATVSQTDRSSLHEPPVATASAEAKGACHHDSLQKRPARRHTIFRIFRQPVAIAACLGLCMLAGSVTHYLAGRNATLESTTPVVTGSDSLASLAMGTLAELDAQGRSVQARQVMASESVAARDGQRLRLTIWDRHEITMGPGARLATNRSGAGGCLVVLSTGQIHVSVNRGEGEGPFKVITPHAVMAVTGTTFTVTNTLERTWLSVRKGTVQLANRSAPTGRGVEMVSAGQTFTTDGVKLVKADESDVPLAVAEAMRDPIGAVQRSPWYKRRFAPLLHLRDYLTERDVEVDEVTLLAISADLWCLQYPKYPADGWPQYIHRKAGLERAARFYGYQVEWLSPTREAAALRGVVGAISQGDLMLAYGQAEDGVEVLDSGRLADLSWSTPNLYRFLGEVGAMSFPVCRIARTSDATRSREELVRDAVADMRGLWIATEDPEYHVGRQAVRAWAEALTEPDQAFIGDPMLIGLNGITKLSVACHDRWVDFGVPTDLGDVARASAEIASQVEGAFATSCAGAEGAFFADALVTGMNRIMGNGK